MDDKDLDKGVPDNDIEEARKGKKMKAADSHWSERRAKAKNSEIAKIQIEQKKQRLEDLSELMLEGRSVMEMADILGYSQTQIRNDIKELDDIWRENTVGNVEQFKRMYIRRKNYVLLEAKKAFEHSKKKRIKTKEREKVSSGGEDGEIFEEETIRMEEDRDGDPRFLKIFSETATDIAEAQGVKTETEKEGDTYILPDLPPMVQKFLEGDSDEDAGGVDEDGNPVEGKDDYTKVSGAEDADYEELNEEE
jgi:hypothetical protein